ncbi:MAG: GNAT family N-acetyltransferase [Eubacteriales bacterium]|nr:GNAT family N-acetyltransferase [Eubacteriales bacterium]
MEYLISCYYFENINLQVIESKCIKELEDNYSALEGFDIKVLHKEEIERNWSEIWRATGSIIEHLKRAPVFYPADEFTEEIYNEYFMSEDLELIVAYKDDTIAGIIEWNKEENEFMRKKGDSVNVGEAFVYPEYRRTGLSEKLLSFSEKRALAEGYKYMWVEHGTANPNARGFWDKYFYIYSYELVRTIMR